MKRFVAALLVLTMVMALAGSALAACDFKADSWVEFKKDSAAYNAAKSSKKTNNVVQKGSHAWCDKICGKYARLVVNVEAQTKRWFKVDDLKKASVENEWTRVVWAKGGKGMSTYEKGTKFYNPAIKGFYVKVSGHTNLRKSAGMKCKSQGVVEKGDLLKLTGYTGFDDRGVLWAEICRKSDKLWLSSNFIRTNSEGRFKYYDKNGNCVEPAFE